MSTHPPTHPHRHSLPTVHITTRVVHLLRSVNQYSRVISHRCSWLTPGFPVYAVHPAVLTKV
jgi:hypothetical protein